jgi:hypothetical protein
MAGRQSLGTNLSEKEESVMRDFASCAAKFAHFMDLRSGDHSGGRV